MRAALLVGLCLIGCTSERASREVCDEILDRIVALELKESGFRDPALLERKKREMRQRFAKDLVECETLRLRRGALACIRQAQTAEDISHRCLH